MLNEVRIIGNVGRDPESKQVGTSTVTELSVATTRRWTDSAGAQKEDTQWHRVICWAKLAETVQRYVHKGSKVFVAGRLQTRKWQNKEGNDTWTTEVIADRVLFLDAKSDAGSGSGYAGPSKTDNEEMPF